MKILGFKSHKYILDILKKVSISVVCSRWDEPFGRASLEACSRGCATIISNKGGLPETTNHPVIINHSAPIVCESGIKTEKEVEEIVKKTRINNFLIGESLLKDLDKNLSLLKKITQINT